MVPIELVYYHQHIYVAEGNEADGEDAQGTNALLYKRGLVGSKKPGDCFWEQPDDGTGDYHSHGNETERLADNQTELVVVALTHLYSSQRLDGAAGARNEQIVNIKDVHAHGEGKDTCSAYR